MGVMSKDGSDGTEGSEGKEGGTDRAPNLSYQLGQPKEMGTVFSGIPGQAVLRPSNPLTVFAI